MDTLSERAMREGAAFACFYFDFAVWEEQSPAAVLGSVLKQIVAGLDEVPERIADAFRDRRRLQLGEIVKFLLDISFSRCTYICIDALDECLVSYREDFLDSLNHILRRCPGARIFLTGRPHIRDEVEERLAGKVAARYIAPTKNDIVIFLRAKLKEDAMPNAMDQSLEEEIIKNIPETVSEM